MIKRWLIAVVLCLIPILAWGQGTWDSKGIVFTPQKTTQGAIDYPNIVSSQAKIADRLGKDMYVGDPILGNTLQTSVAYLTANTITAKLHLTPPQTLTANLTIPSFVTLAPDPGAVITLGNHTLTINGPFQAGPYQVFAGSGTVVWGSL